ncbi:oligopeptide transporter [Ramicandelaber brevisporus]|nr:oligopeptide transporter [Ramicandelaber brevisporus]
MLPSLTFRVWVLGIFFCIVLSALNQFLWFRANPISITILVVQILAFPLAKFMEWLLPRTVYSTAGLEWTFNPGPFTIKEHVLISIFANAGVASAYAIDIVVVKKVYFGTDIGFTGSLLLVFSSQMIGYGLAGVCRQYLVYPAAMIWPANLANIVLFRTFHESSNWTGWSRTRMFWTCFIGSFLWYWLPGYLFTMLSFFSVLCFFNRDSVLLAQLGDGQKGMAVLALTFDWSNISSTFLFSPIVTPFWAALNVFVGFVLVMWILTPIGYYLNVWDAKKYPIYSYDVYDIDGHVYNVTRVLDSNHNLNVTEYYKYSPLRMSYEFSFTYGLGFAGFTCILSYIYLHYGEEIWLRFRASKRLPDDIHMKLMRVYPEVPQWWYLALFVVFFALGVIACIRYDLQVKWYIFLLALAMALLCTIPIGIIQAVTNQQLGTNILSELVYGYIYPGMPIGNVTFKTFAYITTVQGLLLVQDLKLGHYMKIPPRHMFICQTIGTLIAALVQLGLTYIMIDGMPDLCKDTPDNMWNCSQAATFFSASLIFGLASPKRVYNDQDYALNLHGFWVGVLLPIPFYYLARRYPDSWVAHIHIPVILSSSGWLPPSPPVDYSAWFLVNLFFNFYVKRYRTAFWERFAFAISAGLDAGLAVSTVLIFVALTNNGYNIEWWGTQRVCRNAGVATNGPEQK